jgi:hypothetical protein
MPAGDYTNLALAGQLLDALDTLFGQFGNAEITAVADVLDGKLEELVAEAIRK